MNDTATTTIESDDFNRKEREHIAALERRLEHLRGDHPERRGDPAYPPGEAYAISWALSVLAERSLALRVARLEKANRDLNSRFGHIEAALREEEDEL